MEERAEDGNDRGSVHCAGIEHAIFVWTLSWRGRDEGSESGEVPSKAGPNAENAIMSGRSRARRRRRKLDCSHES